MKNPKMLPLLDFLSKKQKNHIVEPDNSYALSRGVYVLHIRYIYETIILNKGYHFHQIKCKKFQLNWALINLSTLCKKYVGFWQ